VGHPNAVLATVVNNSRSDQDFSVDLDSVILRRQSGNTLRPVVYADKTRTILWATSFTGTFRIELPPGGAASFLFFFEDADAGDTISIEGLGATLIE